jgi:hypothetical protein
MRFNCALPSCPSLTSHALIFERFGLGLRYPVTALQYPLLRNREPDMGKTTAERQAEYRAHRALLEDGCVEMSAGGEVESP